MGDYERVRGSDDLDTLSGRDELAAACFAAGQFSDAAQLYRRTLAGRADLAYAYYAVGWLTDGLAILRDTLARCERSLPPGDPLTHAVRESLANIAEE